MLDTIDLNLSIEQVEYERQLTKHQAAFNRLTYQVYLNKRPVIIVFEGWNASGIGQVIRKLTAGIDPRGFVVHSICSPEEYHYLWPYWRNLPDPGRIAIFDQSWYRRVLVERVECLRLDDEWQRAYREINHFERQLVDFCAIIHKFWLHIDRDEQLKRFELGSQDQLNRWRYSGEDRRSQEKWDQYIDAINEMLLKTNTLTAPWTVVEANSEPYAHVKILKTIVDQLCHELDYDPFSILEPAKGKKKKKKNSK